jgi:hypothetical protein
LSFLFLSGNGPGCDEAKINATRGNSNSLQQGDILVASAGQSTGGLSFMQACLLFKEHAIVGATTALLVLDAT